MAFPPKTMFALTIERPYGVISHGVTKLNHAINGIYFDGYTTTTYDIDISPNSKYVAIAIPFNGGQSLKVYDSDTGVPILTSSLSSIKFVRFSPDGTMLVVGSSYSPHLVVYDTSTWAIITTGLVVPDDVEALAWSGDSSRLAFYIDTPADPFTQVVNTSDWSLVNSQSGVVDISAVPYALDMNHDGSAYFISSSSASGRIIGYNAVTNADVPISVPLDYYSAMEFSFDGTMLIAGYTNLDKIVIWSDTTDLSTYTIIDFSSVTYGTAGGNGTASVRWVSNNKIAISFKRQPGLIIYDLDTADIDIRTQSTYLGKFGIARDVTTWEVAGTIDENVAETRWKCTAYDLITGEPAAEPVITSTATFSIAVNTSDPLKVTVEPEPFDIWRESDDSVSLGDHVYPVDTTTNPFYFKCTTAGTTGSSEPTWASVPGATVVDGSVVWELIERINQPVTHAPIMPTPI